MEKGGKSKNMHSHLPVFSERNSKRTWTKKNVIDYWAGRSRRMKNERYGGIFTLHFWSHVKILSLLKVK